MIVYNITIQVNWGIHQEWLPWMKQVHIPEVMATGMFTHFSICKLLDIDETDGPTYTIQYFASHKDKYDYYIDHYAGELRRKNIALWADQFHVFRTLMEVVN